MVNGHGGNSPISSLVAADVGTRQNEADVGELNYLSLVADAVDDIRKGSAGSAYHAGEIETSLILYFYSELVEMDVAEDYAEGPITSYTAGDMFHNGVLGMRRTYDRLTEDGVRGEATLATAETGEAIFQVVSDELAALIVEFAGLD